MYYKNNNPSKPQPVTHFHVKDDSHLKEVDPTSRDWSKNDSCFVYIIAREEIEACDTRRLLHDLRTEPGNPFFDAGPGNVIFSVSGYDDDPRDLLVIPEFRSYVSELQQEAPCWLYFAMPGTLWLRRIIAATASDCRSVKKGGEEFVAITASQAIEFMESQLTDFYRLLEMMGIKRGSIQNHLSETIEDSFPELLSLPIMN